MMKYQRLYKKKKTRSLRLLDKMFGDIEHKTQEKLNNDEKNTFKEKKNKHR